MLFTYLKDTDSRKILQVKMTNYQTGEKPLSGLRTKGFYNNEKTYWKVVYKCIAGTRPHENSDTTTLSKR